MMSFLFRRDGLLQGKSVSTTSIGSKNKLPPASIHFLRKIRSIQGVTEAYASDKRTTFVKLENQRVICLKGFNANPLYDCLREMYRAQENEQFLTYLQGSRSSGASSSEKQRTTYVIPDYDFGVSCSDNVRDYVLKKKFPGRDTPGSAASKTSLMSGSQSSLDGTNYRALPKGVMSETSSRKRASKTSGKAENGLNPLSKKVPLLQKVLQELKGTEYNNKKYRRAALRQIDQYMRNSFNTDFAQIFTDSSAMNSSGVYADEDEDIFTLGASHQTLKQYENLPFKEHFPPLTTFSDESDDEEKARKAKNPDGTQSLSSEASPHRALKQGSHRRNSDQTGKVRGASGKSHTSHHRRHTIANPQKKDIQSKYIKVYRPGQSRPIFISGATTLGGLPDPPPTTGERLSDRLKHKPISLQNIAFKQSAAKQASNSCPLFYEMGEQEAQLEAGHRQTSSYSESYLYGRQYKLDNSEKDQGFPQRASRKSRRAQLVAEATESQYESSLPMEKSLQETNDLVRTLFDNLSIGAPPPVITDASSTNPTSPGVTSVSPSFTTAASMSKPVEATLITTTPAKSQFPESPRPRSTASSDSIPSISSNSEERNTV